MPENTTMHVDETEARFAGLNLDAKPTPVSRDAPTVFIVMGMAGSGKTTFVHVSTKLPTNHLPPYSD